MDPIRINKLRPRIAEMLGSRRFRLALLAAPFLVILLALLPSDFWEALPGAGLFGFSGENKRGSIRWAGDGLSGPASSSPQARRGPGANPASPGGPGGGSGLNFIAGGRAPGEDYIESEGGPLDLDMETARRKMAQQERNGPDAAAAGKQARPLQTPGAQAGGQAGTPGARPDAKIAGTLDAGGPASIWRTGGPDRPSASSAAMVPRPAGAQASPSAPGNLRTASNPWSVTSPGQGPQAGRPAAMLAQASRLGGRGLAGNIQSRGPAFGGTAGRPNPQDKSPGGGGAGGDQDGQDQPAKGKSKIDIPEIRESVPVKPPVDDSGACRQVMAACDSNATYYAGKIAPAEASLQGCVSYVPCGKGDTCRVVDQPCWNYWTAEVTRLRGESDDSAAGCRERETRVCR